MSASARDRGPLLFYVPDEVCVVVDGAPTASPDAWYGGDAQTWYEGVAERLNEVLKEAAASHPENPAEQPAGEPTKDQRVERALARARQVSPALREALDKRAPLLQPLAHLPFRGPAYRGNTITPWTVLRPVQRDEERVTGPVTLCFFRVGPEQMRFGDSEPDAAEITRRTNLVRDLVNAAGGLLPLDHLSGRIRAVAPNWLAAASQYTCPSPGAKPEPIKRPAKGCLRFFLPTRPARGRWRFTFTNREIERLVAGQRSGGEPCPDVTVAILDTSPERGDVDASTGRYPHNLQLADLCKAQYVRIDQDPGLSWPQSYFDRLNGYVPNWRDNLDGKGGTHLDVFFKMPDHGLFAAGIVHDIAPRCAIHLIRVIGGYGVTDLRALVPTLEALPRAFLKSDNQRLVVNLSLGFAIPPGEQLLRAWLKEAYDAIEVDLGGHPDLKSALDALEQKNRSGVYQALQAYLDSLHADVQVIIDWINAEKYALIVAAAGNDNHFFPPPGTIPAGSPRPMRPEPRWPARYDEALGVASVGLGGAAANFSNRGDVTQMGNGVATFGGNASLPTGSPLVLSSSAPTVPPTMTLGTIDTSSGDPDRIDAAKGLYCSDPVCLGGGKNETGWVYWAGTSFSTPVISALAAALWCEHGAEADCWDFGQVINKIVSLAAATGSATDPERLDCPTITARQRFVKG